MAEGAGGGRFPHSSVKQRPGDDMGLTELLILVVPGLLAGLLVGLISRRRVVEKIVLGAVGGAALTYLAINTLDFSDGDSFIIYQIWSIFSLVGGFLLIAIFSGVRRLTG